MATPLRLGHRTHAARVFGFDPGLQQCGWAIVENYEPLQVGLIRLPGKKVDWPTEWDAARLMCSRVAEALSTTSLQAKFAAIEGQHVYRDAAERANDLVRLALVSGAAVSAFCTHSDGYYDVLEPREWKGSVGKSIMFKRILRAARVQFEEKPAAGKKAEPILNIYWGSLWTDPPESARDQEHAIDALGLALYGAGVLYPDQVSFTPQNGPPINFPPRA